MDILFGNESEAESWANANGLANPTDLPSVALALAKLPKSNASRPRTVVITSGAEATVVATSDSEQTTTYPVNKLSDEQIVDTNGAGDAFAGGFMGAYVLGKDVAKCVEVGHKLGAMCVGQVSRISCTLDRKSRLMDRSLRLAPNLLGRSSKSCSEFRTYPILYIFLVEISRLKSEFQHSPCSKNSYPRAFRALASHRL